MSQGLGTGLCPLCRVSHGLNRQYMVYFGDAQPGERLTVDATPRAGALCADHAEQLIRVEVDARGPTLGVRDLYLSMLERLRDDLETLEDDAWLTLEACPACLWRDAGITTAARHLLGELVQKEALGDQLAASSGLCVPHFQLAWDISKHPAERRRLVAVQGTVVRRHIGELQEQIRGKAAELAEKSEHPEGDPLQRAICLTAGWPAPAPSPNPPHDGDLQSNTPASFGGTARELGRLQEAHRVEPKPKRLTPREIQVLQLAANGFSGRQIADELVLSPATVKSHCQHIYTKLNVSDRASAVAIGLRHGFID